MQSQIFAGMLLASAIAHAALCFVCGVVDHVAPKRVSIRIFMLLVFALALFNGASAGPYLFRSDQEIIASLRVASLGRIIAIALLVRLFFHLRAEGADDLPRGAAPYYLATGLIVVSAGLAFWLGGRPPLGTHDAVLFGLITVHEVSGSATVASVLLSVLGLAGSGMVTWVAWTMWRRQRRSVAFFFGATVLSLALLHDLLREADWLPGPRLGPAAFVVMMISTGLPAIWKYLSLQAELEQRTTELKANELVLMKSVEDLRTAQDELVKKEQLAAVGELSAVIAHEVRNPLAIMTNAISTLRRPALRAEDRETLLAIIEEETLRLNRLVGDLLRYAKPVRVQRQLISLGDLVERGLKQHRRERADVDIALCINSAVDKIWGDATLLAGIIDNLLNNAMQAMTNGGHLTVRLEPATVNDGPGVELEIEDTGEGMSTIVRSRAMDPFFTTRPSGTGLGLAIVARVIDAHGGQIKIRSASGEGTIVHVLLPTSQEGPGRASLPTEGRLTEPPMLIEVRRALKSTGDFS